MSQHVACNFEYFVPFSSSFMWAGGLEGEEVQMQEMKMVRNVMGHPGDTSGAMGLRWEEGNKKEQEFFKKIVCKVNCGCFCSIQEQGHSQGHQMTDSVLIKLNTFLNKMQN